MKYLIRCDSYPEIGTGHAMRTLALAQAFKDSGSEGLFLSALMTEGIAMRLKNEGLELITSDLEIGSVADAKNTVEIGRKNKVDWIITDGYLFLTAFQQIVKDAGIKLMCIDDIAGCRYVPDVVLNQNPGFGEESYPVPRKTKLLMGPKYALLRREFRTANPSDRAVDKKATNVLVTMGGADANNLTANVINVLNDYKQMKRVVFLGSANPNINVIKKMIVSYGPDVQILIDVEDVTPYMLNADIAIHAGGSTSWELAFMGVPSLCYILSDNQAPIAASLARAGYSINMGRGNDFSKEKLKAALEKMINNPLQLAQMAKAGRALVDGKGSQRVVKEMGSDEKH